MSSKKTKKNNQNPSKSLKDFEIKVNPFGELESNFGIEKVNEFLNKSIDDKKLKTEKEEDSQQAK